MKRKLYLMLGLMILCVAFLNGILFYSTKLSMEYVQSKNVWGVTQSIRLSDYRRQLYLLSELPKDPAEAENFVNKLLAYVDVKRREKAGLLSVWRNDELTETPKELEGSILLSDLQETDVNNYNRLRTLLAGTAHYQAYLQQVQDNANSVISILYPIENDEKSYHNALQCMRDYADLDRLVLVPTLDNGVNLILQYHATDYLAFLLLVMISLLFYYHLKKTALNMAGSIRSLTSTVLRFYLLGLLCLYVPNVLITWRVLGLPSLQLPIQSLESFYSCPYPITLGAFWLIWLAFKICTLLFILFTCLLVMTGKRPYLTAPFVLLFLVAEFLFSQSKAALRDGSIFQEINLFSGMTSERFFNRYLNVGFTVQAFPRLWLFLATFTIPFLILCVLSYRRLQAFWENAKASLQKVYSDEIDKRYQETRRLWHDFNNHLLAIKALYGTGHAKEAEDYIEKLAGESREMLLPAKTGRNAVDLLLFQKSQTARDKDQHVTFTISCDLTKYSFQEYDLCSLFGNLLDNAMEASEAIQNKTPEIKFRLESHGDMIFCSCENEFVGERREKGGQLLTTKKDAAGHGIGLASVKQICHKYGGTMETKMENGIFLITLLLNNSKH